MVDYIFTALFLMLIFEGMLPFVAPSQWRQLMLQMTALPDEKIRTMGLISMLIGATCIYFIN